MTKSLFKKSILFISLSFWLILYHSVEAQENIQIKIKVKNENSEIANGSIALNDSCAVTANEQSSSTSFSGFKAICALAQAKENNIIENFQVSDWGFGWSLDGINSVFNTPDWSQSWSIRINNFSAQTGIDGIALNNEDELLFSYGPWPMEPLQIELSSSTAYVNNPILIKTKVWDDNLSLFIDFSGASSININNINFQTASGSLDWTPEASGTYAVLAKAVGKTVSDQRLITILAASSETSASSSISSSTPNTETSSTTDNQAPGSGGGGGGQTTITHNNINVEKAANFLSLNQNPDGSFGSGRFFTDWAAVALGSLSQKNETYNRTKTYLLGDFDPGSLTADYERRAMALMSLDINPYTGTKTNYILKISSSFDGQQIGDNSLVNDDIFGLLVLLKSGYEPTEEIIKNSANFILSNQDNGSWGSVDLTAAAIQSLLLLKNQNNLDGALKTRMDTALESAFTFLRNSQKSNGGFDNNSISTSWAIQALAANGESETSWEKNYLSPSDFLYSKQMTDGGLDETTLDLNSRLWSTSYAIPAGQRNPWSIVLKQFTKPATAPLSDNSSSSINDNSASTSTTVASSTEAKDQTEKELILEKQADDLLKNNEEITIKDIYTAINPITIPPKKKTEMNSLVVIKNKPANTTKKVLSQKITNPKNIKTVYKAASSTNDDTNQIESSTQTATNSTIDLETVPKIKNNPATTKKVFIFFSTAAIITGIYLGLRFFRRVV